MPTSTVRDLVTASLRKIRVIVAGQPLPNDMVQDSVDEMNRFLETWALDGKQVYRVLDLTTPLTGAESYTIGIGGQISVPRPLGLQDSFTRVGQLDYPYTVVPVEVYTRIAYKSLGNIWPVVVYYEPTYPLGIVHAWPVGGSGTLHLKADMQFSQVGVNDSLSFPPGYPDVLIMTLAVRMAGEFGQSVDAGMMAELMRAETALRRKNARPAIASVQVPTSRGVVGDDMWIQHGGAI